MSAAPQHQRQERQGGMSTGAALVIGSGAFYLLQKCDPLLSGYEINGWTALAGSVCAICAVRVTIRVFDLSADGLTWIAARLPRGDKGQARFAKSLPELKGDVVTYSDGAPYWAAFKGKAVHSSFSSVAYVLGASGSGKTARFLIPFILSLAGRHNKVIFDLKPEIAVMVIKALKAAGEKVDVINLTDQQQDIVGAYDVDFNVLNLIADLFWKNDGLLDVTDITYELCLELYSEPRPESTDQYWRDGSRRLMGFVLLCRIILDGYEATLGDAHHLLSMREDLLHHAKWISGRLEVPNEDGTTSKGILALEDSAWADKHSKEAVNNFCGWFRALALSIVDLMEMRDSRTFESYQNGALNKLERFNRTTRAYQKTKRSTYNFNDLKEGDQVKTLIVMMDVNKRKAQEAPFRTIRWAMMHTIKSHPNRDKLVFIVADEASNLPWEGREVSNIFTICRGYGARVLLAFQNYAAIEESFGKNTCEVLKSESEIVLLMPNQRNVDTLSLWEKLLGRMSYISKSDNGTRNQFGVKGFSYHEEGKPVMDFDQLRRNDKGLLMIRSNRILPVDLPFYWEIHPYKNMVGQSPSHKSTPRKRTKVRIRKMPLLLRLLRFITGGKQ